jgi:hypothetical protein
MAVDSNPPLFERSQRACAEASFLAEQRRRKASEAAAQLQAFQASVREQQELLKALTRQHTRE